MSPELWVCILCPTGAEWVYTYDPGDLLGECPHCHYSVGVLAVTYEDGVFAENLRRTALESIAQGRIEHLDPVPS